MEIEKKLEELGIFRLQQPSPFPQASAINSYLIKGERNDLIDTGVRTKEGRIILFNRFQELGIAKENISNIFLTHGHIDHAGNAAHILRHSHCNIYIHPSDKDKITIEGITRGKNELNKYWLFFKSLGIPEEKIKLMKMFSDGIDLFLAPLEEKNVLDINEGDEIKNSGLKIKVYNFPGHTKGMLNYYIEEEGILFSGDHIIPGISPNPLIELENGNTTKSLVTYLKSIERVKKLPKLKIILPGHGKYIEDPYQVIDGLLLFYKERGEILEFLKRDGTSTPYQLIKKLFPELKETEFFLGVSEIIGNLEVLEEKGLISREKLNTIIYFHII